MTAYRSHCGIEALTSTFADGGTLVLVQEVVQVIRDETLKRSRDPDRRSKDCRGVIGSSYLPSPGLVWQRQRLLLL